MRNLTRIVSTAALAVALATAACNRNAADGDNAQGYALPMLPATLPLETGEAQSVADAPVASDLPDAPALKLARVATPEAAYGYANAAGSYDDVVGDAPPDYAFDYDGVDPWAWQGYDDSLMVAEPVDDGYRYYYYRHGEEEPYFVRDPWYSYGYGAGMLAAVYAADGGIVPYDDYGPRAIYASRYYARGRALRAAALRGRRPIVAATWLARRPVIVASRTRWAQGRIHQPAWQALYASERPAQVRYWQVERDRRDADARRFADWRQTGFRAAPPPRAIPPAWRKADWAKDDGRYRPAAASQVDRRDARQEPPRDHHDGDGRDAARLARTDRSDGGLGRTGRDHEPLGYRRPQPAERQPERLEAVGRNAERAAHRQADGIERQRAERPERPQRANRVERPERAERPQPAEPRERPERRERVDQQRTERAERPERGQPERAQRFGEQQAQRRAQREQQQQAEEGRRREAEQGQRQAEQAQRRQAEQAQRRQGEQAQRQQALQAQRQAEQVLRQQAAQAERQQAAQAQRQQAQQAERQQMQQQRQAERQQMQQPRQEQRGERRRGGRDPN